MITSAPAARRSSRRAHALIGLGGALLTVLGDVLILGRPCSGADFDQAVGQVPRHIDADPTWRSLWNGASLASRRIHAGTLVGVVGIVPLQWLSMRGIARSIRPGKLRSLAAASATAFAVAGGATHLCCGAVILAYREASRTDVDPTGGTRPSPRSFTGMLAVSAAGSLTALALYSGSLAVAALRGRSTAPTLSSVITPFPCVMSTLLTFGALPAPLGGYLRPASISTGLTVSFAAAAASAATRLS
jgi:hypothetical protein